VAKITVTPREIEAASLEVARKKGTGSFFLDILGAPLLKRPALSESVAKYRKGLTGADVAAGEAASKATGLGRIFEEEIRTPIKTVGGLEVSHVQKVRRLTAPLVKAQKLLVPIFAYEGLRRMMGGGDDGKKDQEGKMSMTRDEQAALLKAASVIEKLGKEREQLIGMLASALHEKQARKLASEMVTKGFVQQDDLDKKAEELAKEDDLGMVKKALDLTQNGFDLGKIEKKASVDGAESVEDLDPMTAYLVDYIHGR
jgi:hypothetical protein